jgi:putative transposase
LHARIANIRADFTHKLTTRLCRENQATVIGDLHVKRMPANDKLACAISDAGLGMFRSQMEYKAKRYKTRLVVADRWYPGSRLCSVCGWKNEALSLRDREWGCPRCGTRHDRDLDAARNLERLATVAALPGRVRPATAARRQRRSLPPSGSHACQSHEYGLQDGSGQEKNRTHLRALS